MAKRTPAVIAPVLPAPVPAVPAVVVVSSVSTVSTLSAINEVMMVPTYLALALVFVPVNWLTGRYNR